MGDLEYAEQVYRILGGEWPYRGAEADAVAANRHGINTPQQTADFIRGKTERYKANKYKGGPTRRR